MKTESSVFDPVVRRVEYTSIKRASFETTESPTKRATSERIESPNRRATLERGESSNRRTMFDRSALSGEISPRSLVMRMDSGIKRENFSRSQLRIRGAQGGKEASDVRDVENAHELAEHL